LPTLGHLEQIKISKIETTFEIIYGMR